MINLTPGIIPDRIDVVILIIDSQYGPSKQDSKISSLIKKNNKGIFCNDLREALKNFGSALVPVMNYEDFKIIS